MSKEHAFMIEDLTGYSFQPSDELTQNINTWLNYISESSRLILQHKYGLNGFNKLTMKSLAEELNKTFGDEYYQFTVSRIKDRISKLRRSLFSAYHARELSVISESIFMLETPRKIEE